MKLNDVLVILEDDDKITYDNVYINGKVWSSYDIDNEYLALLDVPVYHYFNNGDGTIIVDTMWS